jgi:hypothetical protein
MAHPACEIDDFQEGQTLKSQCYRKLRWINWLQVRHPPTLEKFL